MTALSLYGFVDTVARKTRNIRGVFVEKHPFVRNFRLSFRNQEKYFPFRACFSPDYCLK